MIQEIPFNTVSTTPNDYVCTDGDLSLSADLLNENQSLRNTPQSKTEFTLPSGHTLLYIHHRPEYTNYIYWDGTYVCYADSKTSGECTQITQITNQPTEVTSIGNTLMLLTSNGIEYVLWKTSKYNYLGNHIPELSLSFGLQGNLKRYYDEDETQFDDITFVSTKADTTANLDTQLFIYDDDQRAKFLNHIHGFYNDTIKEVLNDNKFFAPFFVRYAYKLYDGSIIMPSAPILMIPDTSGMPHVYIPLPHYASKSSEKAGVGNAIKLGIAYDSSGNIEKYSLMNMAVHECNLDFCALDSSQLDTLKEWGDIITGIVIYVSEQLSRYEEDDEYRSMLQMSWGYDFGDKEFFGSTISKTKCIVSSSTSSTVDYGIYAQRYIYDLMHTRGEFALSSYSTLLPHLDREDYLNRLIDNNSFFKLKEYKITELSTTRSIIEIKDDNYLGTIADFESLADDYNSHDTLVPNTMYALNGRLNIANIKRDPFNGFRLDSITSFCEGKSVLNNYTFTDTTDQVTASYNLGLDINGDTTKLVQDNSSQVVAYELRMGYYPKWFYYPNSDAKYLDLFIKGAEYKFNLSVHPTLNGAYCLLDYFEESSQASFDPSIWKTGLTYSMNNELYTSRASNPFVFDTTEMNSVGSGSILQIVSATKALSEGQFGQFPLYAFTDEGIWALQTNTSGGYDAVQPVARDICVCTDSICQLDSAIAFVSQRGVMVLQGSDVVCLSDKITQPAVLQMSLPNLANIISADSKYYSLLSESINIDIRQFIKDCVIVYDYTNQRLIVFKPHSASVPESRFAFVYSFKSQAWTCISSTYSYKVNSYPDAYVIDSDNNVLDISTDTAEVSQSAESLVITRPIKLGTPNEFKYIDAMRLNGYLDSTDVKQILYGSNDLKTWTMLQGSATTRLQGSESHPYKFFRLAIVANLNTEESLSSMTFSFHTKGANDKLY